MDLIHKHSLIDSLGNVVISEKIITTNAHEFRKEEVELQNETYTVDLTKYTDINLLYIEAYYNENSIVAPSVAIGDLANFSTTVNGTITFPHRGYMYCYPTNTTPITSLVIDSTLDNRKIKYVIVISTES